MTPETRAKLREGWQKRGNQLCKHRIVEEEEGTGAHICIRCGAKVPKRKPRKKRHGE